MHHALPFTVHACLQQGIEMVTADGRRFHMVPLPLAWIADLLETANLLNVLAFPAAYPDPNFLVHKSQLNNPTDVFPLRTEAHHDKASHHLEHRHGLFPAPCHPAAARGSSIERRLSLCR